MNFDNRSRRDDFTFSIHDTAMNENNFISTSHGFFIVFLVVFQAKTVGICYTYIDPECKLKLLNLLQEQDHFIQRGITQR